jgi:hypothetical protein
MGPTKNGDHLSGLRGNTDNIPLFVETGSDEIGECIGLHFSVFLKVVEIDFKFHESMAKE